MLVLLSIRRHFRIYGDVVQTLELYSEVCYITQLSFKIIIAVLKVRVTLI